MIKEAVVDFTAKESIRTNSSKNHKGLIVQTNSIKGLSTTREVKFEALIEERKAAILTTECMEAVVKPTEIVTLSATTPGL